MNGIEDFIGCLEENKDKVFEFGFGDYWLQMPFGLIGDVIKRVYAYALEERNDWN